MQSMLDRSCFTAFAQGFCLLILELGATLVQGPEEYYPARTSAEEIRRSNLCLYRARHVRRARNSLPSCWRPCLLSHSRDLLKDIA